MGMELLSLWNVSSVAGTIGDWLRTAAAFEIKPSFARISALARNDAGMRLSESRSSIFMSDGIV